MKFVEAGRGHVLLSIASTILTVCLLLLPSVSKKALKGLRVFWLAVGSGLFLALLGT